MCHNCFIISCRSRPAHTHTHTHTHRDTHTHTITLIYMREASVGVATLIVSYRETWLKYEFPACDIFHGKRLSIFQFPRRPYHNFHRIPGREAERRKEGRPEATRPGWLSPGWHFIFYPICLHAYIAPSNRFNSKSNRVRPSECPDQLTANPSLNKLPEPSQLTATIVFQSKMADNCSIT